MKVQKGTSSGKGEAAQRKSYGEGAGQSERKRQNSMLTSSDVKSAQR